MFESNDVENRGVGPATKWSLRDFGELPPRLPLQIREGGQADTQQDPVRTKVLTAPPRVLPIIRTHLTDWKLTFTFHSEEILSLNLHANLHREDTI